MSEREAAEDSRRLQQLGERVSRLRITETSRDGMVRVTVSATGLLADLSLKAQRPAPPAEEIAAQVMDCVRRAQARIPDLLRQAMHEFGVRDPNAHLLLAEAGQRFPAPPPRRATPRGEPSPIASAPPRRAVETTAEDDWDEREVMK